MQVEWLVLANCANGVVEVESSHKTNCSNCAWQLMLSKLCLQGHDYVDNTVAHIASKVVMTPNWMPNIRLIPLNGETLVWNGNINVLLSRPITVLSRFHTSFLHRMTSKNSQTDLKRTITGTPKLNLSNRGLNWT